MNDNDNWKLEIKKILTKWSENVINFQVIPDIQRRVDYRIPDHWPEGGFYVAESQELEDYIESLFHSQIHEIEKLKKNDVYGTSMEESVEAADTTDDWKDIGYIQGYNSCLSEVLQILGEREGK